MFGVCRHCLPTHNILKKCAALCVSRSNKVHHISAHPHHCVLNNASLANDAQTVIDLLWIFPVLPQRSVRCTSWIRHDPLNYRIPHNSCVNKCAVWIMWVWLCHCREHHNHHHHVQAFDFLRIAATSVWSLTPPRRVADGSSSVHTAWIAYATCAAAIMMMLWILISRWFYTYANFMRLCIANAFLYTVAHNIHTNDIWLMCDRKTIECWSPHCIYYWGWLDGFVMQDANNYDTRRRRWF